MNYIKSALKEILQLCGGELRKIFTDGGVMLLLFGATLIYPLIYSFTYAPEVLQETPVALVNQNDSKHTRELKRMLDATAEIDITMETGSLQEAELSFYEGDVAGIILIPENFTSNLYQKEAAHLAVYADASYMMLYKQVYQAAAFTSQTLGKKIEVKKRLAKGTPTEAAIKKSNPVAFESHGLFNPQGGYGSYAMPAILVLVLQQTLLLGIGMRGGTDRELGAKHYLLPQKASLSGALRIIFGKTLAYLLLYIPISFYLFVVVMRWFHFPQAGDPSDLFILSIPLTLASIMLGFLFTTFFKNRENSMIFLLFTSVPLIFLSGFSWPVESFPFGFEALSHLFPSSAGIQGLLKISVMGGTIKTAMPEFIELWTMVIAFFIINWIIVRVKMKRLNAASV
ncbi:Inner membrane transport permease YbhR [Salinivirga cyanobacteriivorans]|uniref:Inner membrane transport permease YbhR n=1 Tax=Salinivirga cyanobacteriivorans TaxID=1307839 RepID=A0A0S2HWU4_9BACT|nr:ABC transporter permease [Salinivirga cyanobacteriivorans]ALO14553.1 Inner membrane transport permease YbhR [Salinivirga cyanobacteriivorans]